MDLSSRRDFHKRRRLKAAVVLLSLYILTVEWAVYVLHPWWLWPTLPVHNETSIRVLVVGDPQLLGRMNSASGFFGLVERWDADRYIRKTFHRAHSFFKPHVVIFVGDLFDEGEFAGDRDYESYFRRFLHVFRDVDFNQAIIIPGDNDIGGEVSPPRRHMINRFYNYFRSDPVTTYGKVDFVKVSYLTRSYTYRSFLTSKKDHVRVIVSHLPLTSTYGSYVKDTLQEIEPDIIFSGHQHLSEYIASGKVSRMVEKLKLRFTMDLVATRLNLSDGNIHEIQVPTSSYRMGTHNVGYGAAIIDADHMVTYGVLWLPKRLVHLYGYLVVLCVCLLLVLTVVPLQGAACCFCARFCRRNP